MNKNNKIDMLCSKYGTEWVYNQWNDLCKKEGKIIPLEQCDVVLAETAAEGKVPILVYLKEAGFSQVFTITADTAEVDYSYSDNNYTINVEN